MLVLLAGSNTLIFCPTIEGSFSDEKSTGTGGWSPAGAPYLGGHLGLANSIGERYTLQLAFRPSDPIHWALCAGLCIVAIGCGRSNVDRLPVFGSIIGPGTEKLTGSVSFIPEGNRSSPGCVASLVNGQYRFDRTNGPGAGRYRILIRRAVTKTRASQESSPELTSTTPETTGRDATLEWTLTRDIAANGPYQIDFELH
jgi:hypothetical protein